MTIDKAFAGGAVPTTISGSMTNSVPAMGQTFTVADATGYPAADPFVVVVNRGELDEEKILVASRSGSTFTVDTRGYDNTTAQSHSAGAVLEHELDALTVQALVDHVNETGHDDHTQYLTVGRHDIAARHAFGDALGVPDLPADVGAAASAGSGDNPAREDHVHELGAAVLANSTPAAEVYGGAGTVGVSGRLALADHVHPLAVPTGIGRDINQVAHGLAVSNAIYLNGTSYAKAKADAVATSWVVGVVTAVADADNFTFVESGLAVGLSGLTAGTLYYLSAATAGLLTATEPTAAGHHSVPVLFGATATTGYIAAQRQRALSLPLGYVSHTSQTSNQLIANTAGNFGSTAVAGTAPTGRRWKLSFSGASMSSSVANDTITISIYEGATKLCGQSAVIPTASGVIPFHLSTIITPTAGAHTYQVFCSRPFGTGTGGFTAAATEPAILLIEDIGAV